jgi:peptidoglycan/xylan/chitin deacetylase (PgdA/CDA1 family)
MKEKLLWGSLIFLALYMFIPWVVTRILGLGVIRKGRKAGQVALTFDDGPDPLHTPRLLDMLRDHGAKATFFVLGAKAEKHPELIKRIHDEGHQIGVHNYTHWSNWLMTPWTVKKRHVNRSADIVERITGERPAYYRPPWGIINLIDFFLRDEYQIVLWSVMPRDWRSSTGSTTLKKRLYRKMTSGSIVLLHDSGETFGADEDAPVHMLEALEDVLYELRRKDIDCVRIDEMIGSPELTESNQLSTAKRMLVASWMLWERAFIKIFHVVPVDMENPLLQLRVREYHGNQEIELPDGEFIRKGDRIFELHLSNDMLFRLGKESRTSVHLAIQLIRRIEQVLPLVLQLLQNDPNYHDVKGLYGVSMIHRGTKQLGFTVLDLPKSTFSFLTQWYLKFLMYVVHPDGKQRLKTKSELLVPKIIAISKKELMNRYAA